MTYEQFCQEFMQKSISVLGDEIHMDCAVIQDLVDAYPKYAERWFFDTLREAASSGDKKNIELLYPVFALVAAILQANHGITGPGKRFKSK